MSKKPYCPAEKTLAVIGGRWKVLILWSLFSKRYRFGELHRSITGVTQKMLTQQLRELEADGLVERTVYAQVPPKVEYSITEVGLALHPVIDQMCKWGQRYSAERGDKPSFPEWGEAPEPADQNHA